MILGVLSDTHNHRTNLQKALHIFRKAGVETVLHCGDVTEVDIALQLVEFRVICTFGNNDWNAGEIRKNLLYFNRENYAGMSFQGEIGGVKIGAAHGHLPDVWENMAHSGEFAYVFHGHTHRCRSEQMGITRVINPGALGGSHFESRSCVTLDLDLGTIDFHTFD